MKAFRSTRVAAVLAVTALVSAQYLPFSHNPPVVKPHQLAMGSNQERPTVLLSDVLGQQKPISLFASFTRDVDSVSARLESDTTNTTLLAPVNSAISGLPRKPWEDPTDYAQLGANAYLGTSGTERAAKNFERFMEAHMIPVSPWKEGQKVKSLAGEEHWWEIKDGTTMIMPGRIEVERVAKSVGNGEVWVLRNVINYAS